MCKLTFNLSNKADLILILIFVFKKEISFEFIGFYVGGLYLVWLKPPIIRQTKNKVKPDCMIRLYISAHTNI